MLLFQHIRVRASARLRFMRTHASFPPHPKQKEVHEAPVLRPFVRAPPMVERLSFPFLY